MSAAWLWLAAYPDQYAELATKTHADTKSILDAERSQFGLDHCQAGQMLGESWRFPNELQQAASRHLELPVGQDLLSLVQTACRLAVDWALPPSPGRITSISISTFSTG
jgi:HD-like signal output (HDOD) protein